MFFNNYTKPGRGVSKEDLDKSGVSFYFDILFRRIWKMIQLNLLYVLVSIPAIVISAVLSLYFLTMTASVKNISIDDNATTLVILSLLFAIIFFQLTGSGPASVAKNYVLRKYVNDKHSWVVSDFFEHIKKSFKQGMAVYIINTLVLFVLLFAWMFYSFILEIKALSIVVITIAVLFVIMQLYIYQLVASVELSVKYIYKNALALTIIKLPWNLLVMIVTGILMYGMYYVALNIPILCVALLIVIYFVLMSFTQIFMTNNALKKYIIEPGLQKASEQN